MLGSFDLCATTQSRVRLCLSIIYSTGHRLLVSLAQPSLVSARCSEGETGKNVLGPVLLAGVSGCKLGSKDKNVRQVLGAESASTITGRRAEAQEAAPPSPTGMQPCSLGTEFCPAADNCLVAQATPQF